MTFETTPQAKVFGLGLARTGTTAMHEAMGILGLRSAPSSATLIDGLDPDFLAAYDAFFDNPIPFLRHELEERFPESLFIVTWRPVEPWLESMEWLFGPGLDRLSPELRQLGDRVHRAVYGVDQFDPDRLAVVHRDHYDELRSWSADRNDVLWIDQSTGFDWEPLCRFLDRPVPDVPFPTVNASTGRPTSPLDRVTRWLRSVARRGGGRPPPAERR